MIIIISHPADDHAQAVQAELAVLGEESVLVDTALFPRHSSLALHYGDPAGCTFRYHDARGGLIDLGAARAVWWRRPLPLELDPRIPPDEIAFTWTECAEAINGLWHTLPAFWMNDPGRDEVATHKSHQLHIAQQVGLDIPRTLITNDPAEAEAFLTALAPEPAVYKCFSATEEHWRETRVIKAEELQLLDRVRLAPVIFQQFIPAQADLRVTVVGGDCFPAAVYPRPGDYQVDFRMNLQQARIEAVELPAPVVEKLHTFMDRLGLVYGAIDLRLTPEGEYIFLEVNPSGQWRFIEKETGQPITAAVARTLVEGIPAAPVSAGRTEEP